MLRTTLSCGVNIFRKTLGRKCGLLQSLNQNENFTGTALVNQAKVSFSSLIMSRYNKTILQPNPDTNLDICKRFLTKFSLQSGKRKTVHAVLKRFYRLDWGIWIHAKCGRNKKLFRKSVNRKRRLRQHVFTNARQSWLLDSMVTNYWRKQKYYIDNPYEPYHRRDEFPHTRKTPRELPHQ